MSSTRLPYDDGMYSNYVKQSTGGHNYMLNPSYNEQIKCYPDGVVGHPSNFVLYDSNQADIENELSNRTIKNEKYRSNGHKSPIGTSTSSVVKNLPSERCTNLYSHNTLLTNPKSNYRNLSLEKFHFDYLNMNPQNHYTDFVTNRGKNTREIAISNFEKKYRFK